MCLFDHVDATRNNRMRASDLGEVAHYVVALILGMCHACALRSDLNCAATQAWASFGEATRALQTEDGTDDGSEGGGGDGGGPPSLSPTSGKNYMFLFAFQMTMCRVAEGARNGEGVVGKQ